MKIGILTFHSAHNYGAVLQCYALQNYLYSLGHDVYVIDYRNPYIMRDYEVFNIRKFFIKNPFYLFKRILHELKYYRIKKRRYIGFNSFINNFHLSPVSTIQSSPYDLIIIGSDQVWNYNLTHGFDKYYWGNFEHSSKTRIVSYAASMHDNWPKVCDSKIRELLKNFDCISVRESKLAEKISLLMKSTSITQVVDPTLLFSGLDWEKIIEKPDIDKPYLFLYQVDINPLTEAVAQRIAKERNLCIIKLYAQPDKPHTRIAASTSPRQFLGWFKYASFIVCSSFHGTVFSIQFKKSFYSVKVSGKNSRIESLLSETGLLDRMISEEPSCITDIDYSNINYNMVEKSKEYIQQITQLR